MPHERDLEILDILGFRDFEESEVPRIQKFLAVPVLCHGNVVRKRCARRGRASVCLERVSARPTMLAMPTIAQEQVWENREFSISIFW